MAPYGSPLAIYLLEFAKALIPVSPDQRSIHTCLNLCLLMQPDPKISQNSADRPGVFQQIKTFH